MTEKEKTKIIYINSSTFKIQYKVKNITILSIILMIIPFIYTFHSKCFIHDLVDFHKICLDINLYSFQ